MSKITPHLTQEDIKDYLFPGEDDARPLVKVISYFKEIKPSEVKNTAIDYNTIKNCLMNSGLGAQGIYLPVFADKLMKAKNEFLKVSMAS